jgi:ureidoglycolate hydrolase
VNHHPDGGQLFASNDGRPFLVPAIPAGADPDLDRAVVIRSDGDLGVCLRPGVWHDGVYPASGDGDFLTRQGRVHARISCDVAVEFGCLLRIPLDA